MAPARSPTEPQAPADMSAEVGPKPQQDVHFVCARWIWLKIVVDVREPLPPATSCSADDGTSGLPAAGPLQTSCPPAVRTAPLVHPHGAQSELLDPTTLALQVSFTPWTGPEVTVGPVPLLEGGGEDSTAPPRRRWVAEKHFRLCVDEACVRAMANTNGDLMLPIRLAQPPPPPPPKPVKGQPPPPEATSVSVGSIIPFPCASLMVGDTQVDAVWPSKLRPLPLELSAMCTSVRISLQALTMPPLASPPEEHPAPVGKTGKVAPPGKPGGKAGAAAPPPEPDLSTIPGEPCACIVPELATKLNPMVIMPVRAGALPDAPATRLQLDNGCYPVRLRTKWGNKMEVLTEQTGTSGPWVTLQPRDSSGPGLSARDVGFGRAAVLLLGDVPREAREQLCRTAPLTFEVHDRSAIPSPPQFPVRAASSEAAGTERISDDEGYVCGIARMPLLDLARDSTCVRFMLPIAPYTTIRGAASLDWTRRPGNYASSQASLKGWVKLAVPLSAMDAIPPGDRVFTRAVFVMDYRDSELFHLLEDTIRQRNAWTLGMATPAALENNNQAGESSTGLGLVARPGDTDSRFSTPRPGSDSDPIHLSPGRGTAQLSSPGAVASATAPGKVGSHLGTGHRTGAKRVDTVAAPPPMERMSSIARGSAAPTGRASIGLKGAKELRFHDFGEGSESSGDESGQEEPATEVDLALETALGQLSTIKLDNKLLQTLSTAKLTAEELADPSLDILTGFHLVDGKERIIVVEGRADGGMRPIQAIFHWAVQDPVAGEGWRPRLVLYNDSLRFSSRLWGELGVDLHILKLASPLPKLVADAASYATGMVRVECIAGLRRLAALRTAPWARLANDLCLYPTPHMVHLVDKKFGGELTKADVFGHEVLDGESSEAEGNGLGGFADDARSSHSSKRSGKSSRSRSCRSGRGRRSGTGHRNKPGAPIAHVRQRPRLQPIDRHNEAYMAMREEARVRRIATDWHANNLSHLTSLEATASAIRADWATWNPQREAAHKLEEALASGALRFTANGWQEGTRPQPTQVPGTLSIKQARAKGWYPHPAAFKWPAPKDPGSYARHPLAPSKFRAQQLAEPWEEEGAMASAIFSQPGPTFVTTVKNTNGLFGQDPEYFKTVHLGGEGREKEEAERKAAEKAEWTSKLLVDDPVMHTTLPLRPKTTQLDRTHHLLQDEPKKKGLVVAHVPPAPYSIFTAERWSEKSILQSMRGKDKSEAFILPSVDFKRHLAVAKRAVSNLGPGRLQSWTAAIHDARYQDD